MPFGPVLVYARQAYRFDVTEGSRQAEGHPERMEVGDEARMRREWGGTYIRSLTDSSQVLLSGERGNGRGGGGSSGSGQCEAPLMPIATPWGRGGGVGV